MLYIRTDMNKTIATGHVMRCLSIADAARTLGEDTTFLLADEQAVDLLTKRGYPYIVLRTKWNEMEAELPVVKQIILEHKIEKLLIDSYQVTEAYLSELAKCVKTIYLDDLNAFHYPVAGLVCYANYWEKFRHTENYKDAKLHLGTRYVPLRQAFWECPQKQIRERAEHLLLLSGGSDPYDILAGILEQLDVESYRKIDVICGAYYTKYELLCERYARNKNVQIHRAVSDIECYMKTADVAISAGGTTLYELCACGTPTISYAFADNQLDNVRKFAADGIMDYAGDARAGDITGNIKKYLDEYRENPKIRQEKSLRMQQLVDGKGALRLAEALRRI